MDGSELLDGPGEHLDHLRLGRDVAAQRQALAPQRLDLGGDFRQLVLLKVTQDEIRALSSHGERNRPAQTLRRSGDHGDLVE